MAKQQHTQCVAHFPGAGGTYIQVELIRRKKDDPKFDVVHLSIKSEGFPEPVGIALAPEEALEVIDGLTQAVYHFLVGSPAYCAFREWAGTTPAQTRRARKAFEEGT
jgi:hypothetical protein